MPENFDTTRIGVSEDTYDSFVKDTINSADKAAYLQEAKNEKISRLSNTPRVVPDWVNRKEDDYLTDLDSSKNKIFNNLSAQEQNYITGQGNADLGIAPVWNGEGENRTIEKFVNVNDGSDYSGQIDSRGMPEGYSWLYNYGVKGAEEAQKLGYHGATDDPRDRYFGPGLYKNNRGGRQEDAVGPQGVDIDNTNMELLLPSSFVNMKERLRHGSEQALDNRIYPDYRDGKKEFGTGRTEAYTSQEGLYGNELQEIRKTPEELRKTYEEFLSLSGIKLQNPQENSSGEYSFEDLFKGLVQVESGGDHSAVSPKGATGLAQLMPATAKDPGYGIEPAKDGSPEENLRVGSEYLSAMLGKYESTEDALMAYNWGPGNVDKWIAGGRDQSSLPEETRQYPGKVMSQLPENLVTTNSVSGLDNYDIAIAEYEKYKMQSEADSMGTAGRIGNAIDAFQATLYKEAGVDFADWIGDASGLWDVGTEETKTKMVNDFSGYNPLAVQPDMSKAKKYADNIYAALLDDNKEVKMSDISGLVKIGITTPELLGQSLGFVASLFVPVLGWGSKAKRAADGTSKLSSAIGVLQKNAGLLQVAAGDVNDQVDAYKIEHSADPSVTKIASMMVTTTAMLGLERMADMSILRSPAALESLKGALSSVPSGWLPKSEKLKLLSKGISIAAGLTANMGKEAGQEYLQSMGEALNVGLNFDDNGELDSVTGEGWDLLTSKEIQEEGIMSAGLGAGGAVQFAGVGAVVDGKLIKNSVGAISVGIQSTKNALSKSVNGTGVKDFTKDVTSDLKDAFGGEEEIEATLEEAGSTVEERKNNVDKTIQAMSKEDVENASNIIRTFNTIANLPVEDEVTEATMSTAMDVFIGGWNESSNEYRLNLEAEGTLTEGEINQEVDKFKVTEGPEYLANLSASLRAGGKNREAILLNKSIIKKMPEYFEQLGSSPEMLDRGVKAVTEAIKEVIISGGEVSMEDIQTVYKAVRKVAGDTGLKDLEYDLGNALEVAEAYKSLNTITSTTDEVGVDAAVGERGFLKYFDSYRKLLSTGNTRAAIPFREALNNFKNLMETKAYNIKTALTKMEQKVELEVAKIRAEKPATSSNDLRMELNKRLGGNSTVNVDYGTGTKEGFDVKYFDVIDRAVFDNATENKGAYKLLENLDTEVKAMKTLLEHSDAKVAPSTTPKDASGNREGGTAFDNKPNDEDFYIPPENAGNKEQTTSENTPPNSKTSSVSLEYAKAIDEAKKEPTLRKKISKLYRGLKSKGLTLDNPDARALALELLTERAVQALTASGYPANISNKEKENFISNTVNVAIKGMENGLKSSEEQTVNTTPKEGVTTPDNTDNIPLDELGNVSEEALNSLPDGGSLDESIDLNESNFSLEPDSNDFGLDLNESNFSLEPDSNDFGSVPSYMDEGSFSLYEDDSMYVPSEENVTEAEKEKVSSKQTEAVAKKMAAMKILKEESSEQLSELWESMSRSAQKLFMNEVQSDEYSTSIDDIMDVIIDDMNTVAAQIEEAAGNDISKKENFKADKEKYHIKVSTLRSKVNEYIKDCK